MSDYPIAERSFDFAVKIVELYKLICGEKKEYVLSKQLLRAGTSVGANIAEAQRGQSKPDFISKMNIALKEANETDFWLRLLNRTGYISDIQFSAIKIEIDSINNILIAIINKAKSNLNKEKQARPPSP